MLFESYVIFASTKASGQLRDSSYMFESYVIFASTKASRETI